MSTLHLSIICITIAFVAMMAAAVAQGRNNK